MEMAVSGVAMKRSPSPTVDFSLEPQVGLAFKQLDSLKICNPNPPELRPPIRDFSRCDKR